MFILFLQNYKLVSYFYENKLINYNFTHSAREHTDDKGELRKSEPILSW